MAINQLITDKIWRRRLEQIDSKVQDVHIPSINRAADVDQDEEWCKVVVDNDSRKIRFHDYEEVFGIPGLYEELFYDILKCCSPSYVANLLEDVAEEWNTDLHEFTVLDVGAGNGMVGDELKHLGVRKVVGVDIIAQAKKAALRDRPGVYDDYRIADLTNLSAAEERRLREHNLNCLTTVAALGFSDIPPTAFLKALDLISTPAWMAFNIKEDFLLEKDDSGFNRLIRQLLREGFVQPQCYRRYRHRLSIAGEPLYYIAMIAEKIKAVPVSLMASYIN